MDIKDISIVITTYKSENKLYSCLNSLPQSAKIIVVENSNDVKFKQKLNIKYPHIECILTGENKGYSAANNIGLLQVTSKYSLVLNPDTIVEKNALNNFLKTAKQYPDFWLIGPTNDQLIHSSQKQEKVFEVDNIKGFAIFLNMRKFEKNFFDILKKSIYVKE